MKGFFKELRQDRIIFWGILITFLIAFLTLGFILVNLGNLPPYLPLFNQLPWGEQRLGSTMMIFIPISMAIFFAFTNILIASFIYGKSQMISRILSATNILILFLSFLFVIRTIELIT